MDNSPVKTIVVTGVSTGIGFAVAEELIERGFRVFGSVRKQSDADSVQQRLGERFRPLLFDVTDSDAVRRGARQVEEAVGDLGLSGLVNNAGVGIIGPLMHMPMEQIRHVFEVNVFGLLEVTRAFLPLLGARSDRPVGPERGPGRIVNISSVSGRIAYPMFGAYAGSKFAVEAISDSLRRELMLYDIDVILIEPGAIETPIWDKGLQMDFSPYEKTDYGPIMKRILEDLKGQRDDALPVSAVSRVVYRALTVRRPKTRYVVPNSPLTRWWIPHLLPDRWLDRVCRHVLKIRPERPGPAETENA